MRVHWLNNVNCALRALATAGVRLVNISSGDIVDGNPKLVLGLVWSIILHWQGRPLANDAPHSTLERTLLAWCRAHTAGYDGVEVADFTASWADGLAFNALLHRFRPHLFDFAAMRDRAPLDRLEHAFALAHDHLGIDRLLDPEGKFHLFLFIWISKRTCNRTKKITPPHDIITMSLSLSFVLSC